jgi:hypothetical protein
VQRFAHLSPPPRYDTRRFKLHGAPKIRYFGTILPGPFYAEPTCGASAALRAFVSALKVRYAQIQHICAPLVFFELSIYCVFWTALPGPFRAEPACGASAALRAFVPAPKVRYAQIQVTPSGACIVPMEV